MGCRSANKRVDSDAITGSSLLRKACAQLTHGSLRGSFTSLTSKPPYANRGRSKSRCHDTARGGRYPTSAFQGASESGALRPTRYSDAFAARVGSDIDCRGTHLHSWFHAFCRSLCDHNVRLFFLPNLRSARMNLRESSVRTRQLGRNRWNQSPRAWACVSCVSEDVLPASDQHSYGFEGNGNTVEKRITSQGLFVRWSPLVVDLIGTRSLLNCGQNFVVVRRLCRL
jgi:hypothetical protein